MSNIVVVKNGNSIEVDFGVYVSVANLKKSSYDVNGIALVQLAGDDSHVQVYVSIENILWYLTFNNTYVGDEYFIVDSIDGVVPTSNEHLYNLISSLR